MSYAPKDHVPKELPGENEKIPTDWYHSGSWDGEFRSYGDTYSCKQFPGIKWYKGKFPRGEDGKSAPCNADYLYVPELKLRIDYSDPERRQKFRAALVQLGWYTEPEPEMPEEPIEEPEE
jgi:hypothetical protein